MFETARAQSELFDFQWSQWELIWNSPLIGRYKEMSPGESYGQWQLIWISKLIGRYKEMSPGESYDISPPWFETARAQIELFAFQCSQWELIWNSQLIWRYKEMSPGESVWYTPPWYWNWQSSEWTLCFSMQSMRAHLKQSTNKKI